MSIHLSYIVMSHALVQFNVNSLCVVDSMMGSEALTIPNVPPIPPDISDSSVPVVPRSYPRVHTPDPPSQPTKPTSVYTQVKRHFDC